MSEQKRELYSSEAEYGVLGALMRDAELFDVITDKVSAADFHDLENAALFQAIVECHEAGQPIDPVTLADFRDRLPSGESTLYYAGHIAKNVPSAANWAAYAGVVRERAILRRVVEAANAVRELATENRSVTEIIAGAQQAMADLRDLDDGEPEVYRIGDVLPGVINAVDDSLNERTVPHLSTGLVDLDHLLRGGLRRKSMVVIAGRPGEGKTMLGLQIAQHVALSGAGVGLVFSLEMTKEELTTRSIASVGGVDLRRLDDAKLLEDDDWTKLTAAVGRLNPVELYLCDRPGLTVARIRSIARQVQRRHGLDVVVVDYIGLIATSGRASNRAEGIGSISTALKNLSKELGIPVLVLAQLNGQAVLIGGELCVGHAGCSCSSYLHEAPLQQVGISASEVGTVDDLGIECTSGQRAGIHSEVSAQVTAQAGGQRQVVRLAGSQVRHGDAGPKDLAAVQRKDGLMRALTIVYSYFNLLYNRTVDIRNSVSAAKSIGDYLNAFERTVFLIAIPAVVGPLISGQGPGEDEDWRAWASLKIATYPLLGIPGLRDLASSFESGWAYRGATPIGELFGSLSKFRGVGVKAIEGEEQDAERIVTLAIEAIGYGFGLPVAQPKRTVKYLWDVAEGERPDDGIIDFVRGVLFGPPKDG